MTGIKKTAAIAVLLVFSAALGAFSCRGAKAQQPVNTTGVVIDLPAPDTKGGLAVEAALAQRRSVREYAGGPLTLTEAAQLLWAAQGITGSGGRRTAPSAGALYPLEVYLVCRDIEGLNPGVYLYLPSEHKLAEVQKGDAAQKVYEACLKQQAVKDAPATVVFAAEFERTTQKYGNRGKLYVYIEVGHAAQNLCLQAESLGLGAVTIGGFEDAKLKDALSMPKQYEPLYVVSAGGKP